MRGLDFGGAAAGREFSFGSPKGTGEGEPTMTQATQCPDTSSDEYTVEPTPKRRLLSHISLGHPIMLISGLLGLLLFGSSLGAQAQGDPDVLVHREYPSSGGALSKLAVSNDTPARRGALPRC